MTTIGVVITAVTLPLIYLQVRVSKRIATAEFTLRLCYEIFHSMYTIIGRVKLAEILSERPQDFKRVDVEAREPLDFSRMLSYYYV